MTIKVGDKLPEFTFMTMGPDGAPKPMKTADVFAGKKVALFAVPGAFTPTCHKQHMVGFVQNYDELKKKVDVVACTSVNDVFVLTGWAKDSKADGKISMLADGSAEFAKKVGLDIDLTRTWPRRSLQALLDGRGQRGREVSQRRGATGRGRCFRCFSHVQAGLTAAPIPLRSAAGDLVRHEVPRAVDL